MMHLLALIGHIVLIVFAIVGVVMLALLLLTTYVLSKNEGLFDEDA